MIPRATLAAALALIAGAARAEVVDSQPAGFTVREIVTVNATPEKVWAVLIKPAAWWPSDHTFSHDARNLSLEPRVGGAYTESLPSGGGVRHMVVVYYDPPSMLRMEGALGPMQAMGAMGHLTFTLKPRGPSTEVTAIYDLGGHEVGGMMGLAPVVDRVLGGQVADLKAAVESGKAP